MKKVVLSLASLIPGLLLQIMFCSCHDKKPTTPISGYNLESMGVPKFVRANFIDPGRMARISRFRSAIGADYSDDFEHCRSMKHYFQHRPDFDAVMVHSPQGRKLVSYFEVMSDALFQQYQARGLIRRSDAAISQEERDAHPLTCQGETFLSGSGVLEDWFYLK
jgi:hypothetical protein